MSDQQPEHPDQDAEDAAWRDIVDHYGDHPDFPPTQDPARTSSYVVGPRRWPRDDSRDAGEQDSGGPEEGEDAGEYDEEDLHYRPPAPPPVPRPEAPRLLAWLGVVGMPVLLLVLLLVHVPVGGWAAFGMFAAFLGGFGYLVWHMRKGEDDDPWDDGAVV